MGLLSRILKSPEAAMMLLGAGAGGLTASDGEDPAARAALFSALGLGGARGGRMLKGLLSRQGGAATGMTRDEAAIALRKAISSSGAKPTQMPPAGVTDAFKNYDAVLAGSKPQSAWDGLHSQWDEVDRVVDRTGIPDALGGAARKVGEFTNPHDFTSSAAKVGLGAGLGLPLAATGLAAGVGGAAVGVKYIYDQVMSALQGGNGARMSALKELGLPPDEMGIAAFQSRERIPVTGQWDDATMQKVGAALAKKLAAKQAPAEDVGPPAPSLAPHNQR